MTPSLTLRWHDHGRMSILVRQGPLLRLLNYARQAEESRRGTVLMPRASFGIGAHVTRLQRVTFASAGGRRHAVLWASVDGSIGFVTCASRTLATLITALVPRWLAVMHVGWPLSCMWSGHRLAIIWPLLWRLRGG